MAINKHWYKLYQLCTAILSCPNPPCSTGAIRYLSYSPLHAPSSAASAMAYIHLLCLKSIPSFFPLLLKRKNEQMANATPNHCKAFSCSPYTSMAPISTNTGRVAFIGPTIVNGRCFIPIYPNIQEDSTSILLSKIYPWVDSVVGGT